MTGLINRLAASLRRAHRAIPAASDTNAAMQPIAAKPPPGSREAAIRQAQRAFEAACASLTRDDIAIDCGANIGRFTAMLAGTGARVYAFEPNPHAFAKLRARFDEQPNVTLLQAAIHSEAGTVRLYMHQNAGEDPLLWSTGSSILDYKGNVDRESFVEVEAVDLCDFIESVGNPVAILKMDVEGAEAQILKRLIETGIYRRIGHMFVETHELKIPELRPAMSELRSMIRDRNIDTINLDWE